MKRDIVIFRATGKTVIGTGCAPLSANERAAETRLSSHSAYSVCSLTEKGSSAYAGLMAAKAVQELFRGFSSTFRELSKTCIDFGGFVK